MCGLIAGLRPPRAARDSGHLLRRRISGGRPQASRTEVGRGRRSRPRAVICFCSMAFLCIWRPQFRVLFCVQCASKIRLHFYAALNRNLSSYFWRGIVCAESALCFARFAGTQKHCTMHTADCLQCRLSLGGQKDAPSSTSKQTSSKSQSKSGAKFNATRRPSARAALGQTDARTQAGEWRTRAPSCLLPLGASKVESGFIIAAKDALCSSGAAHERSVSARVSLVRFWAFRQQLQAVCGHLSALGSSAPCPRGAEKEKLFSIQNSPPNGG